MNFNAFLHKLWYSPSHRQCRAMVYMAVGRTF
jgi:hypothetical protein